MTEAKSTAKKTPAKAKKPKAAPKVAFICTWNGHIGRPWELVVGRPYRVEVKATQRGGAQSGVVHSPVCQACTKLAKNAAGPDDRGGSVAVEVSEA